MSDPSVSPFVSPPTLDGSASNQSSGSATCTVTLTTTQSNDIIIVDISTELNTGVPIVSSVTATGLTFAQANAVFNSAGQVRLERWWAAAASPLSAVVITVTLSAASDDTVIAAYGVNGAASLTSPFDTGSTTNNGPAANPNIASWTTGHANGLLLLSFGAMINISTSGTVTGFTQIVNRLNSGGGRYSWLASFYMASAGIQTGIAPQYSVTCGAYWCALADTITATAAGVSLAGHVTTTSAGRQTPVAIAQLVGRAKSTLSLRGGNMPRVFLGGRIAAEARAAIDFKKPLPGRITAQSSMRAPFGIALRGQATGTSEARLGQLPVHIDVGGRIAGRSTAKLFVPTPLSLSGRIGARSRGSIYFAPQAAQRSRAVSLNIG